MANEIKGITIEFKGDTLQLENSVASLNRTMSALKNESKLLNKELKLDPNSVEKLNSALKNLHNQQKILTQELEIYQRELANLDQGSKEWLNMSKRIDGVQSSLLKVNQEINKLENFQANQVNMQFKKLGKTISNMGSKITSFGKSLAPLSLMATGILGGVVKSSVEFEQAFAGVTKTVDATEEEFKVLRDGMLELSKTMPQTAVEIASVGESAGQLGIEKSQILDFTETMLGLSTATNLTSEEASTMIAQFANVVDIEGEFERFGSALVDLGNNGASTEKDIMELAQRLSGAGSVAGLSAQEILGLSASMANVGINAEAGGTAMSTLIQKIERASIEGGASLENLAHVSGISAQEFAQVWSDEPSRAIDLFLGGLNEISSSGGNVYATLNELGISEKRLTDTVLRLSSASGEVAKNTDIANKAWEENLALSKEVANFNATTENQFKMMINNLTAIGVQLGQILLPIINQALLFINQILTAFSTLSPEMQSIILAITGIVAVASPLITLIGNIVQAVGKLVGAIGAKGLASVFTQLASPIGLVTSGFALLMATSETFRNSIMVLVESIMQSLMPIIQSLYSLGQTIYLAIRDLLMPVISQIGDILGTYIIPIFTELYNWLASFITPIIQGLSTTIGGVFVVALKVLSGALQGVIDLVEWVFNLFKDLWAWLDDLGVWDAFGKVLEWLNGVVNNVMNAINSMVSAVRSAYEAVSNFISGVGSFFGDVVSGVGDFVGGLFSSGGYASGGYSSGGFVLNTTISVNTSREITAQDVKGWGEIMANTINEKLGGMM